MESPTHPQTLDREDQLRALARIQGKLNASAQEQRQLRALWNESAEQIMLGDMAALGLDGWEFVEGPRNGSRAPSMVRGDWVVEATHLTDAGLGYTEANTEAYGTLAEVLQAIEDYEAYNNLGWTE